MNWKAIAALAMGCGVAFVGLVYPPLRVLYDYAWFVGFGVSFVAYLALTGGAPPSCRRESERPSGDGRSRASRRWGHGRRCRMRPIAAMRSFQLMAAGRRRPPSW